MGILTVGVALAALVLTSTGRLRSELQSVRSELQSVPGELQSVRGELQSVRGELGGKIGALETRMAGLEQRMARLEGLLEGAGLYRPAAAPAPRPLTEAAQTSPR